jgi:NTP pyrophosphatase (non-canonical NTP hydrolase)
MTHEIIHEPKSITELIKEAHENAVEHGWWEGERNVGMLIALMHSELSEALEEYRSDADPKAIYYSGGGYIAPQPTECAKKPEGIPIELADVCIRIFDFCGAYDIDLEKAIEIKMAYNKTRPYRHGGKKA